MVSQNHCPIHCSNSNELIGQELWNTLYIKLRANVKKIVVVLGGAHHNTGGWGWSRAGP